MFKFIKLLLKVLVVLIALAVLAIIGITVFVNPNNYKTEITKLVSDRTGKELDLPGNLAWSFYPSLSLYIERAELKDNPATKENLVIFSDAKVSLSLKDIISTQFKVSEIKLSSKIKLPNHPHIPNLFLDANIRVPINGNGLDISNLNLGTEDEHNTKNIVLKNLSAHIERKEHKLSIQPISASIYNSLHNADFTLDDLSSTDKSMTFNDAAENFEINDLLSGFGYPNKIQGNSKFKIHLTASGDTPKTMQQHLNGNVVLDINNGLIHGIDLPGMLSYTEHTLSNLFTAFKTHNKLEITALITHQVADFKPNSSNAVTPFNRLYADSIINGNNIHNTSFIINHDLYEISGSGVINLETKAIDYNLNVTLRKGINNDTNSDALNFMLQNPLPITITGTVDKPIIKPELSKYSRSALRTLDVQLIQSVTKDVINKLIGPVLPGNSN